MSCHQQIVSICIFLPVLVVSAICAGKVPSQDVDPRLQVAKSMIAFPENEVDFMFCNFHLHVHLHARSHCQPTSIPVKPSESNDDVPKDSFSQIRMCMSDTEALYPCVVVIFSCPYVGSECCYLWACEYNE